MKNINEKYSELCANHEDYEQFKTTTLGNLPKEQFEKIEADYAAMTEQETTPYVEAAKEASKLDIPGENDKFEGEED